jgi:cell division protein FtsI/penicillin-binding protein 2
MKNKSMRLIITFGIFIGLYVVMIGRLFYFQVILADIFKDAERAQSSEVLELDSGRGNIISADNFPLATNKVTYLLYANPKVVKDRSDYAEKLSPIIEVDESTISAKLKQNLFWVNLKNSIEEKQKEQIEKLQLPGVGFQKQDNRYYPESSMSAHLIGFVGKDDKGLPHGYFGLEGYYNKQLDGRPGRRYIVKDALGHPILTDIREEETIPGRDLILGVDRTIQFYAEKRLKNGVEKYNADGGTIIVMESKTGKILAMASYPQFDPQTYYDFDYSSYKNPALSDVFEPGSTFKVLVMAAAIDKDLVKPDTKCSICDGPVKIGGYTIKTWDDKYFPDSTMTDVIQHSDNTGMVFISQKLGLDGMMDYFKRFGLLDVTGIDLQGEVTGEIRPKDAWYPIDVATASFGQGISVTPIQLITAINSIANGGYLLEPHVVTRIIDGKRTIDIKPKVKDRVFQESTTKLVTWMMVNAVENGEAKWTKLPHYEIAGKTGTAQIPVAGHYDPTQTNASFVGFFPAKDPRVTMLVIVNKPKSSIYGAETAAPIFFQVAQDLINYYNIPPDK